MFPQSSFGNMQLYPVSMHIDMGDVVLVACGGAAYNVVNDSEDLQTTPQVHLSNKKSTMPLDDSEAISKAIGNYRIVIPFCILGGELGTDIVRTVIKCARGCGCKVVSVLGMPMEIEAERRERASKTLSDITSISDVSLVFDMTRSMEVYDDIKNRRLDDFLKMMNRLVMKSIESIIETMDGPFFTIFQERTYAFSSATDVLPVNAVQKAWDTMLFDNNTEKKSCIILVGNRTSTAEMDYLRDRMVMEHGIMPEVIRRSDKDDSKVIVFKAVSSF